jgi:hypothetical protein
MYSAETTTLFNDSSTKNQMFSFFLQSFEDNTINPVPYLAQIKLILLDKIG